jgi:hypothetical protein
LTQIANALSETPSVLSTWNSRNSPDYSHQRVVVARPKYGSTHPQYALDHIVGELNHKMAVAATFSLPIDFEMDKRETVWEL